MPYIGSPAKQFTIPVTLDADCQFTINRLDPSGNPVDWNADIYITIDIDRTSPTTLPATVTGNVASVLLPAEVCNQVKPLTRWRLFMSAGGLITPIAVGNFERSDGGGT